jgi:5-methylcytosine-specific restriction endonuclease McrA
MSSEELASFLEKKRVQAAARYAANPEKEKVIKARHRAKNREKLQADNRARYAANPEKYRAKEAKRRAENPEKVKASQEKYKTTHREDILARRRAICAANPEKQRARNRKYYVEHPEEMRARTRQHRIDHPEKVKASYTAWVKKNPGQSAIRTQKRRARKANAPINDFTHAQWVAMQEAYDHRCVYCGKRRKGKLTQDHITPLSKGGSHTLSNIVPACSPCNSSKFTNGPPVPVQPLLFVVSVPKPQRKPRKRKKE